MAQTARSSNQPRYVEVARRLQQDIADGKHPVGALLPTETELCESFGVSRFTVREALRSLRELGLVTRRQGSGTQVIAADSQSTFSQSLASITDVLQYARDTYLELDDGSRTTAKGELARLLGCATGRTWLRFSGLRRSGVDGDPICLTDVYIDPDFGGVASRIGTQSGAIYELIEEDYGIRFSEILQEMSAVVLTDGQAKDLDAEAGSPALRIVRRYLVPAGKALEVTVSIHPADRYSYAMRIRRDSGDTSE